MQQRFFDIKDSQITLHGNTFHIKEQIKQMGGKWNPSSKNWFLSYQDSHILALKDLGFLPLDASIASSEVVVEPSVPLVSAEQDFLHVSGFVALIESCLKSKMNQRYWVTGEISSYKTSNGHVFFDLIDKKDNSKDKTSFKVASISCVLWSGRRQSLQDKLSMIPFADGIQVKLAVSVDFRKEGARIMALVENIDVSHTQGNLLLQRQNIVQELKKRGLYNKNKTLYLQSLPLNVALITAENSRACADFINELKLSHISFSLFLFDCNMQGENTSDNVCSSLKKIATEYASKIDVVVITRGGGSRLDLRWFDDLEIAKHIAYMPMPVVTAVGHFDDISVADEVSFHSEKTPTAAARFLASKVTESCGSLFLRVENLGRFLNKRFDREKQLLAQIEERVQQLSKRRIDKEKRQLDSILQVLNISKQNILRTMNKGYALVKSSHKIITGKDFIKSSYPESLELEFMLPQEGSNPMGRRVVVQVDVKQVDILEGKKI